MADDSMSVEIPRRALFKAAEVCDILNVQPYVLRSWESEFPELGVAKSAGRPRVYRRTDVEQVARIKHLLLVEGLTLAGARKRLEEELAPVAPNAPVIDELIGQNARERLTAVKRGLRSILEMLSGAMGERERVRLASAVQPRAGATGRSKSSRKASAPRRSARRSPRR